MEICVVFAVGFLTGRSVHNCSSAKRWRRATGNARRGLWIEWEPGLVSSFLAGAKTVEQTSAGVSVQIASCWLCANSIKKSRAALFESILPIRVLDGDIAVSEGEEIAAVHLHARAVCVRPGERPFRHASIAGDEMPGVCPCAS